MKHNKQNRMCKLERKRTNPPNEAKKNSDQKVAAGADPLDLAVFPY